MKDEDGCLTSIELNTMYSHRDSTFAATLNTRRRSGNPANGDFLLKPPAKPSSRRAADWQGSKWQQHLGEDHTWIKIKKKNKKSEPRCDKAKRINDHPPPAPPITPLTHTGHALTPAAFVSLQAAL